jgi:hypothetical protein
LPRSLICGDTIRDSVTEECDDGPGDAEDSCTPDCRVRNLPVVSVPSASTDAAALPTRRLGTARHQAVVGDSGIAVTFAELRPESPTPLVRVQRFDEHGARSGTPIDVSPGTTPTQTPNPAIAALPGMDRYAVAWIDGSGGTPDVALRLVSGNAPSGRHPDERRVHARTDRRE